MNASLFFDNAGDERGTPQDTFDSLNAEFHFDVDVAANKDNAKCEMFFGPGSELGEDALTASWGGLTCFMNPPYSMAADFMKKAREEAEAGATVVCLLPVRSDTRWWHDYVWDVNACRDDHTFPTWQQSNGDCRPGVRLRLLKGRLEFTLHVSPELRAWIKSPETEATDIKEVVKLSGLPKMAIIRIRGNKPDEDLLDAAPFPSCVVIFTKAGA